MAAAGTTATIGCSWINSEWTGCAGSGSSRIGLFSSGSTLNEPAWLLGDGESLVPAQPAVMPSAMIAATAVQTKRFIAKRFLSMPATYPPCRRRTVRQRA